jgi:hypothetical protein
MESQGPNWLKRRIEFTVNEKGVNEILKDTHHTTIGIRNEKIQSLPTKKLYAASHYDLNLALNCISKGFIRIWKKISINSPCPSTICKSSSRIHVVFCSVLGLGFCVNKA